MAIINYNEQTFSNLDGQLYNKLKIGTSNKNSETLAFLKDLYTYPPKFKIVWNSLDELSNDTLKRNSPFMDIVEVISTRIVNSSPIHVEETRYLTQDYIDGYINKSLSE